MNCEFCHERMAEFLLDELPESEAVLVQEHFNLCARCMRTFQELKGTGKALDAVPAMRAVRVSDGFRTGVRRQAAAELGRIVAQLPPDKRLKLDARRAARMGRIVERPAPQPLRAWSLSSLLLAAAGAIVLAAILLYPKPDHAPGLFQPIGVLGLATGNVAQFYQRNNEPYTPARAGKRVLPNDTFSTLADGRARFDLNDENTLFLGPGSQVTFRIAQDGGPYAIQLERGELGLLRSASDDAPQPFCEVRTEAGHLRVGPDSHLYLKVEKPAHNESAAVAAVAAVTVLAGSAEILERGMSAGTVSAGQSAEFGGRLAEKVRMQDRPALAPQWRLDLLSELELSKLLGAPAKVKGWKEGGVEIEMRYTLQSQPRAQRDWQPESQPDLEERAAGALQLAPRARMRHSVPLGAPLAVELNLGRESSREASFAFGVLKNAESGVSAEVAPYPAGAALRVQARRQTVRNAAVAARAKPGPETLRLEIARAKGGGWTAQLSSSSARSKPVELPREGNFAPAPVWLQSLGEGLVVDEIKLTGIVPADWLRQRLSE